MSVVVYQGEKLTCTGQDATVPDNAIAKLMYYLNSVAFCVAELYITIPKKLRDYENYSLISDQDRVEVLWWAQRLHPENLKFVGAFVDDHTLCEEGYSNEFYKRQEWTVVPVPRFGQFHIMRVMAFTEQWLTENYKTPMKTINGKLRDPDRPDVVIQEIHNHITHIHNHTICSVQ